MATPSGAEAAPPSSPGPFPYECTTAVRVGCPRRAAAVSVALAADPELHPSRACRVVSVGGGAPGAPDEVRIRVAAVDLVSLRGASTSAVELLALALETAERFDPVGGSHWAGGARRPGGAGAGAAP